jgi:lantibiotic modifying enzyme
MSGAAGALLALLSLHGATGSRDVLATAEACGEHLLLRRTATGSGPRAWETSAGVALTGYSHGAAGIVYALLRLFAVTGERALLDAAVEGMEFERAVFSEGRGNWPDLRSASATDGPGFPVKWCHGASGIALARLGGTGIVDIAGVDAEIDAALGTTRDALLQHTDYLCCGNLGRVETLVVAHRPELRELAEAGASAVVARARCNGCYKLFVDVPGLYNPGFFQGMAGIGYELLRVADDRLPSVLLWE